MSYKNIYGPHVLVTGASSGIGASCARLFAENGCHVTGVSRHLEEKEVPIGQGSLKTKQLDITDEAAVHAFIEDMPEINIAVLCAGMGVAGPVEELPMEMTRAQMEVNYFGTLHVVQAVLKKMRLQKKGLILIVGSIAGRVSIPMQSQYSSSKYALEALCDSIRMEMKPYGVRAAILEPGDTKTGFTAARKTCAQEDSPYRETLLKSIEKMSRDEQNGKSPDTVARAALSLAGKKNPPVRVPIGADYRLLMVLLRILPDRLREKIITALYL